MRQSSVIEYNSNSTNQQKTETGLIVRRVKSLAENKAILTDSDTKYTKLHRLFLEQNPLATNEIIEENQLLIQGNKQQLVKNATEEYIEYPKQEPDEASCIMEQSNIIAYSSNSANQQKTEPGLIEPGVESINKMTDTKKCTNHHRELRVVLTRIDETANFSGTSYCEKSKIHAVGENIKSYKKSCFQENPATSTDNTDTDLVMECDDIKNEDKHMKSHFLDTIYSACMTLPVGKQFGNEETVTQRDEYQSHCVTMGAKETLIQSKACEKSTCPHELDLCQTSSKTFDMGLCKKIIKTNTIKDSDMLKPETCKKGVNTLRQHIKIFSYAKDRSIIFECKTCGRSFSETSFKKCLLHKVNKPSECKHCGGIGFGIYDKSSLSQNIAKHYEEKKLFVCETSDKKASCSKSIVEKSYTRDGQFECEICGEIFCDKGSFTQHSTIHTGNNPLVGETSDKELIPSSKIDVQQHILTVHSEGPSECESCGETFWDKGSLNQHLKIHTGNNIDNNPLVGESCDKEFPSSKSDFQQHLLAVHSQYGPFLCECCGKKLSDKRCLDQHIAYHTGINPTVGETYKKELSCTEAFFEKHLTTTQAEDTPFQVIFECKTCGKNFSENSFNKHIRMNRGNKPSECNSCSGYRFDVQRENKSFESRSNGKSISDKSSLNQSITIRAEGNKLLVCKTCDKLFCSQRHLRQHLKLHILRPFPCKICGKRFNRKSHLQQHTLRIHNRKPFECKVCGKRYCITSNFQMHMRTHTGERPFKCPICGQGFNEKSYVKHHLRHVHNEYKISSWRCLK